MIETSSNFNVHVTSSESICLMVSHFYLVVTSIMMMFINHIIVIQEHNYQGLLCNLYIDCSN